MSDVLGFCEPINLVGSFGSVVFFVVGTNVSNQFWLFFLRFCYWVFKFYRRCFKIMSFQTKINTFYKITLTLDYSFKYFKIFLAFKTSLKLKWLNKFFLLKLMANLEKNSITPDKLSKFRNKRLNTVFLTTILCILIHPTCQFLLHHTQTHQSTQIP